MRTITCAAAVLSFLASLPGQAFFEIFPGPIYPPWLPVYTRLTLGPLAGEILMEVPDSAVDSFFKGVGGDCVGCRINQIEIHLRDTDFRTSHVIQPVLRSNLAAGGPNMAALGILYKGPAFTTASDPGGGLRVVDLTYTFCIPCTAINCTGGFSIGVQVDAGLPGDQLFVGAASYTAAPAQNDYPRPPLPLPAPGIYAYHSPGPIPPFPPATVSAVGYALKLAVHTCDAPVLNMGNTADPTLRPAPFQTSYGVGGMWPDPRLGGRAPLKLGDGLSSRVRDGLNHAGDPVILAACPFVTNAPPIIPPCVRLWLFPLSPLIILNVGILDECGELETLLAPPGNNGAWRPSAIWFEAFTLSGSTIRNTNAQKVQF